MKSGRIGFIIQARTSSTRLPNKVMIPFYGNQTILDIQIERLHKNPFKHLIILATTTNSNDDVIEEKHQTDDRIKLFRGEEQNVLKRFVDAATLYSLDHVIRICSDNPFLLSGVYTDMIQYYFNSNADYLTYRFKNNTPTIKSHIGLYGEVASVQALKQVLKLTTENIYLEHVTNYLYANPELFNIRFLDVPEMLEDFFDKLRLTVDTEEDFEQIKKLYGVVIKKYGEEYKLENILEEINNDRILQYNMQTQIANNAK
jgi:spore coat polysaccharide biosynthesis protein SpsF